MQEKPNGDGTYEVTTTSGYIFKITLVPSKDNVEDIQIEHIGCLLYTSITVIVMNYMQMVMTSTQNIH